MSLSQYQYKYKKPECRIKCNLLVYETLASKVDSNGDWQAWEIDLLRKTGIACINGMHENQVTCVFVNQIS